MHELHVNTQAFVDKLLVAGEVDLANARMILGQEQWRKGDVYRLQRKLLSVNNAIVCALLKINDDINKETLTVAEENRRRRGLA